METKILFKSKDVSGEDIFPIGIIELLLKWSKEFDENVTELDEVWEDEKKLKNLIMKISTNSKEDTQKSICINTNDLYPS